MYKLCKAGFTAFNGEIMDIWYRENTNDLKIIKEVFEKDKYKICKLDLRKNDIVIDLGAHIGAATLLLASLRDDLKIFAWEAMRENFNLLYKNIEENRPKSQINIFNQAMWFYDDDKVKLFYGDSSKEGREKKFIGSLFLNQPFYHKRLFKKAAGTNLSEAFEENRIFSVRFMKMNIEGSEYGVLKAAPKGILEMIDRIHGEYHWVGAKPLKNPRSTLIILGKDVYNDITPGGETKPTGTFQFIKNTRPEAV